METMVRDIQYGYRTLLKNPGFTAVAVLSLALGIGANTAIFSFIDTVLLQDMPVHDPGSLVVFGEGKGRGIYGGPPQGSMDLFGWQQYRNFRSQNKVFQDIAASNSLPTRVYFTAAGAGSNGTPTGAQANLVSGNYFELLGVRPAAGRFFDGKADATGAAPWIVLNHAFWTRHFNRSDAVLGQAVRIGDHSFTIIGVAPAGFFGTRLGESPDFWIPMSMVDSMPGAHGLLDQPLMQFACLVARLKPRVSMAQAQADVNVLYQQMLPAELGPTPVPEELEQARHARIVLKPGGRGLLGFSANYEAPLRILMIVVALVLVIACANVANLLLALGAKRQKEFALRVAIGAKRSRVIRQLLTESLMMSACGGVLGILLASGGSKLLVHLISTGPRALPIDFDLDWRVMAFTTLLSAATGVLFGLAPALRSSRVDLNTSLKESKASMTSPSKVNFGRLLVAGQVAVSLGLLVTAGLLLHSFSNLMSLGTGFDKQNVLLFKLDSESSGYKADTRLVSVYRRIEEKIGRLPGVGSEGVSLFAFNEGRRMSTFQAPGINIPAAQRVTTENFVSPGYFSVLHIPLLLGRGLDARDTEASEMVAVVSESFAKKFFGSAGNALGRQFTFDDEKKPARIAGIAGDAKIQSVRDKDLKMVYRSAYQMPDYLQNLAVRVSGDPVQVSALVREAIRSTERNLPIRWTTTLAEAVSDSLVRERAIAQLTAFFAGLALLLSAIGLYGTISFAVARRTSEIGIRMALGAERVGVLGMVLKDAMRLAAIGMAIGLPLALIITRQMGSMLYGLDKVDPWSVAGAVAALTAVAALAGYLPARRAAAVDPMVALRYE